MRLVLLGSAQGWFSSLAGQTLTWGESLPIIILFLTCQEFIGMLIGLVMNGARSYLFWHVV